MRVIPGTCRLRTLSRRKRVSRSALAGHAMANGGANRLGVHAELKPAPAPGSRAWRHGHGARRPMLAPSGRPGGGQALPDPAAHAPYDLAAACAVDARILRRC